MMLIATINNGDANAFRERVLEGLKFIAPTSRTIDPAAKPRTDLVMSRYMGSSLLPNSPCLPRGSNTTGFPLLVKKMISQTNAKSPMAVATPGEPGNNMIEDTGYQLGILRGRSCLWRSERGSGEESTAPAESEVRI